MHDQDVSRRACARGWRPIDEYSRRGCLRACGRDRRRGTRDAAVRSVRVDHASGGSVAAGRSTSDRLLASVIALDPVAAYRPIECVSFQRRALADIAPIARHRRRVPSRARWVPVPPGSTHRAAPCRTVVRLRCQRPARPDATPVARALAVAPPVSRDGCGYLRFRLCAPHDHRERVSNSALLQSKAGRYAV